MIAEAAAEAAESEGGEKNSCGRFLEMANLQTYGLSDS